MLTVEANAKINLTLDILGKRPDGYHEVAMVMQETSLHDTLSFAKTAGEIRLSIPGSELPADDTNLCWRAARLMIDEYSLKGGVDILLDKHIPIAAGLAGGSADAAAVLKGMNQLYGLGLGEQRLCELGARLGSDIPFCIMGGTMLSTGRGEILKRLPDFPEAYVVLAKPPIGVSTAWAYRTYDNGYDGDHPDNGAMLQAIADGDMQKACSLLGNVLEAVTITEHPIINKYKQKMLNAGAIASMMSGSGPTVFGLADSEATAENIAAAMQEEADAAVFVAKTVSRK